MKKNLRLQATKRPSGTSAFSAKQGASVRPRSCGLTVFLRTHRAAGRNPLGFSLHPFPAAFRPPLAGCAVEATLRGRTGSAFCVTILVWPSGEIGRHSRLKICRGQPHVGSSPTSATISTAHPMSISLTIDDLFFAWDTEQVEIIRLSCGASLA
jgi:hypothetical protein